MNHQTHTVVTKDDIVKGLRELGLQEGDVVLAHTSLSRFGYVEGGAEAVVDALLEAVGPSGTVCMPTASYAGSQNVWLRNMAKLDVRQSPSCLGAINNALMNRPEAIRSLHPTHPCSAIGPHAEFLTKDHHYSPSSVGGPSPFMRNIELGGKLLFLGMNLACNTTFHAIEEHLTGYRLADETQVGEVVDYDGNIIKVPVRVYAPSPATRNRFVEQEGHLAERGLLIKGKIGDADVMLIDAKGMYEYCVERAQEDEFFLLDMSAKIPEPEPPHPLSPDEQHQMRLKLRELMGMEAEDSHPGVILCSREEHDDVTIEDLRICVPHQPDEMVPVLVAIPRDIQALAPAIVCLHGSGRSREFVMEREYNYQPADVRLHGWGRELARRGFVTIAPSQRSYGGRLGLSMLERAKVDQIYGRPAMGGLVEDCLAVVDYLTRRPDVGADRIGCTGFSLGGIVTFYAACLEERIRLSVPVCGGVGSLAALADHGQTGFHSTYFYIPNILLHFDHPQLLAAICPRACKVIGAVEDVGMPLDAVEDLGRIGKQLYTEAGCPDSFDVPIYPGKHDLTPQMLDDMTEWFREAL